MSGDFQTLLTRTRQRDASTKPGFSNAGIQRTITSMGFNFSTEAIANTSFGQWAG